MSCECVEHVGVVRCAGGGKRVGPEGWGGCVCHGSKCVFVCACVCGRGCVDEGECVFVFVLPPLCIVGGHAQGLGVCARNGEGWGLWWSWEVCCIVAVVMAPFSR